MQELMVYEKKRTGRKQKMYGFTPIRFLNAFGNPQANARSDLKNIMRIWVSEDKFAFKACEKI